MYLPALKSRCLSTRRIASAIARGPAPFGPCSGRSEAISTSGFSPPATSSPQTASGSVPARGRPAVLTHAPPAPAASACTAPTATRVTSFVRGSIRETVPSM